MLKTTIKCRLAKIELDLENFSDYAMAYGDVVNILKEIINEDNPHRQSDVSKDMDGLLQLAVECGVEPGVTYTVNPSKHLSPKELKEKYPEAQNTEQRRLLNYLDDATKN